VTRRISRKQRRKRRIPDSVHPLNGKVREEISLKVMNRAVLISATEKEKEAKVTISPVSESRKSEWQAARNNIPEGKSILVEGIGTGKSRRRRIEGGKRVPVENNFERRPTGKGKASSGLLL